MEANDNLTLVLVKNNIIESSESSNLKGEGDGKVQGFLKEEEQSDVDDPDFDMSDSDDADRESLSVNTNKEKVRFSGKKKELEDQSESEGQGDDDYSPKVQKKRETRIRMPKAQPQIKKPCQYCHKMFKPRSLYTHIKVHHEKDPAFINRIQIATMSRDRVCPHCNETVDLTPQQFFHHKDKCEYKKTGVIKHTCEICGAEFGTSAKYHSHWNTCSGKAKEHGIKRCNVEGCKFQTKAKFLLDNHVRNVHLGLPKTQDHVCNHCGKAYNILSRLNNHIRDVHLNIRPFECKECGKTFTRKPRLMDHMDLHRGILKYLCPYCERPFGNSGSLCNHKKSCASSPHKKTQHSETGHQKQHVPSPQFLDQSSTSTAPSLLSTELMQS